MAAISMAHTNSITAGTTATTTSTITPPSSSHGDQTWDFTRKARSQDHEISLQDIRDVESDAPGDKGLGSFPHLNGTSSADHHSSYYRGIAEPNLPTNARKMSASETIPTLRNSKSVEAPYLSPPYGTESLTKSASHTITEVHTDLNGAPRSIAEKRGLQSDIKEDDNSKWIHRDKLARIESEELQAAGIILPRPRPTFKSRRDYRSQDTPTGPRKNTDSVDGAVQSRKNSFTPELQQRPVIEAEVVPSWDLRLPEEIATEGEDGFWVTNGSLKGSRIPVAKTSPAPIPADFIERESPCVRKHHSNSSGDGTGESIAYPKPRSRSASFKALDSAQTPLAQAPRRAVTDTSPKKGTGSVRRTSGPSRATANGGRPKTRSGSNKDSTSSSNGTRPSTRSGDLSGTGGPNKAPEGDPPWMVSAYRPDPRLPPDQQLLPTVARRLQQEKWEKEGKFGNVYDKEFRPLTDEGFLKPPEAKADSPDEEEREQQEEWPLKADNLRVQQPKSPGSYSTMPKIQDKPPLSPLSNMSPLPSPRGQQPLQSRHETLRMQDHATADVGPAKEKGGCGCCIVM